MAKRPGTDQLASESERPTSVPPVPEALRIATVRVRRPAPEGRRGGPSIVDFGRKRYEWLHRQREALACRLVANWTPTGMRSSRIRSASQLIGCSKRKFWDGRARGRSLQGGAGDGSAFGWQRDTAGQEPLNTESADS